MHVCVRSHSVTAMRKKHGPFHQSKFHIRPCRSNIDQNIKDIVVSYIVNCKHFVSGLNMFTCLTTLNYSYKMLHLAYSSSFCQIAVCVWSFNFLAQQGSRWGASHNMCFFSIKNLHLKWIQTFENGNKN